MRQGTAGSRPSERNPKPAPRQACTRACPHTAVHFFNRCPAILGRSFRRAHHAPCPHRPALRIATGRPHFQERLRRAVQPAVGSAHPGDAQLLGEGEQVRVSRSRLEGPRPCVGQLPASLSAACRVRGWNVKSRRWFEECVSSKLIIGIVTTAVFPRSCPAATHTTTGRTTQRTGSCWPTWQKGWPAAALYPGGRI